MTLWKGEDAGNWKSKHWIALSGELTSEDMALSKTEYVIIIIIIIIIIIVVILHQTRYLDKRQ
jgi:hypothetical protein